MTSFLPQGMLSNSWNSESKTEPTLDVQFYASVSTVLTNSNKVANTIVFIDNGKEAVYSVDSYANIVVVLPINITDKSRISRHLDQIHQTISSHVRQKHPSADQHMLNILGYRMYFYFPETIPLTNFAANSEQKNRTVLGRALNSGAGSSTIFTTEYARLLATEQPVVVALEPSPPPWAPTTGLWNNDRPSVWS